MTGTRRVWVRRSWQTFAPPQPLCPSTAEALLEAVRTWVGAEARDVRQHASPGGPAANYAKALDTWARGINGKDRIPRVSAHLVRKGEEARPGHGQRLHDIVNLYRREYKAIQAGCRKDPVVSEADTGGSPTGEGIEVRCRRMQDGQRLQFVCCCVGCHSRCMAAVAGAGAIVPCRPQRVVGCPV